MENSRLLYLTRLGKAVIISCYKYISGSHPGTIEAFCNANLVISNCSLHNRNKQLNELTALR